MTEEMQIMQEMNTKALDDEQYHKQEALENLRGQFDLQLHIEKNALQMKMDNIERDKEQYFFWFYNLKNSQITILQSNYSNLQNELTAQNENMMELRSRENDIEKELANNAWSYDVNLESLETKLRA